MDRAMFPRVRRNLWNEVGDFLRILLRMRCLTTVPSLRLAQFSFDLPLIFLNSLVLYLNLRKFWRERKDRCLNFYVTLLGVASQR